jgi:excisionase family DNA binding protein
MVTTSSLEPTTVLPPQEPSLGELAAQLERLSAVGAVTLTGPDGERLNVPPEVIEVLRDVVRVMARGQAVMVAPIRTRLTTQEAAELLGVSRPTLVKLLEAKEIPFERPNRHRRLLLSDVLDYRQRRASERRAALDEMVEIGEREGMYEATATPLLRAR